MVPQWTARGGTSDGTTLDSWGEGVDGANQRNRGKGNDSLTRKTITRWAAD